MRNSLYSMKRVIFKNKSFKLNINKFDIHRGAIYLVGGKISSGKSIFLKLLNNSISYRGLIKYENEDLSQLSKNIINKDILHLNSDLPFSFKTVKNYINHFADKYDTIQKNKKDIKSLVRRLGASKIMNKRVFTLSKSQRRIVSLISVISADSKVLIIDDLDLYLTTDELKILKTVLIKKANYDGVTIVAGCRYYYNFPKFASVNITLDSGRIVKVRS
ncbi:MAG: hypothetical protein CMG59_06755 [Candidatus Marinimicrobia bacterium]|nr:hypothetical protein [Candidatus Neomarinimicrobiota bacterium]